MVFTCCVPDCENTNNVWKMHRFPNPKKYLAVFSVWIKAIGNENLSAKVSEDVYNNYRVCDRHFDVKCRIPNPNPQQRGLSVCAIPTLYLRQELNFSGDESCLGTSSRNSLASEEMLVKADVSSVEAVSPTVLPSREHDNTTLKRTLDVAGLRTPRSRRDVRRKFNLLASESATRACQLTPKAKRLYKIASNLKKVSRRLDLENTAARKRIKAALKFSNTAEFKNYLENKLNEVTTNFVLSQMKLQKCKARGRRFNLNDKIFALTLLKQSPKVYKLLRQIFALPSRRTLSNLLQTLPLSTGINNIISLFILTRGHKMSIRFYEA